MSKREFQTEVNQLLQLIIHSLYSNPEIFLRELISNSSDALDKLRHQTLTDEAFKQVPFDPRIDLTLDEEAKTLTIADTGIGMSEEEIEAAMEPFRQLSTVNRTGSGLGLPLTKALVEANCASMSIKSTRGQGTLVEVTFPLVEQGSVSLPAE